MCCEVIESKTNKIAFIGHKNSNVYIVDLCDIASKTFVFYPQKMKIYSWLWHRRLGHASINVIAKLSKRDLVHGLPKLALKKDHVCDACAKGKQTHVCFKPKNVVSTSRPLQLLHIDLCGPTRTISLGGKQYCFVIVDDYSCFTWELFLGHKKDAFKSFLHLIRKLQN
ncbi:hypothetical protein Patl1_12252 [Pistacia atlantica]|uniref:Uncharacterized protein n=1 Tax=Pistacia atlantica TaxID=434234 RepID=A0ACC1A3E8_9ROSI|nr:hypothetical protein Patl1_12252 [Pistacia atlantica]